MDAFYHNPSPCFPRFQAHHTDLISTSLHFSSSTSCSATTFVHSFNLNQALESMDQDQDQDQDHVLDHDHKLEEDDQVVFSGNNCSHEDQQTQINKLNSFKPLIEGGSCVDAVGKECNSEPPLVPPPLKWMSSKMRLMKKMPSTDHQPATTSTVITIPRTEHTPRTRQRSSADQNYDERNDESPNMKIRVCSDCNTTKTPLWRSGPQGPKSLCNACGIRQRKARRAMAAAAANGGLLSSTSYATGNKVIKDKRPACTSTGDHKITHYKKKCKLGSQQSKKNIDFDELKMTLSQSSAFQQVFPHDEIKEAAILLMALSCGLVQG